MNEKESVLNKEKKNGSVKITPSEPTSFDFNKITEVGINFLDSVVNNMEKQAKKQAKYNSEPSEKISKKKIKNEINEYSEKPLETDNVEFEFDTTTLKEQYGFYADMMLTLLNPLLQKEGIDAITTKEVQELINAIFDIIGKYLSQIGAKAESSIKVMKNLKKWINLLKAISNIFAPRIKSIQNLLIKNRAKQTVKKLNKEQPIT